MNALDRDMFGEPIKEEPAPQVTADDLRQVLGCSNLDQKLGVFHAVRNRLSALRGGERVGDVTVHDGLRMFGPLGMDQGTREAFFVVARIKPLPEHLAHFERDLPTNERLRAAVAEQVPDLRQRVMMFYEGLGDEIG